MPKEFKSLLEYRKSKKDWHYDPSVKSKDCKYIGRIMNFDFSLIKKKLEKKKEEIATKLYEEDLKNGTLIPSQLNPESIAASKLDHIKHGYNEHNSKYTQWIDNRDKLPKEFDELKNICGLDYVTIACFKQDPGNTNPWHSDKFGGVKKKINLNDVNVKKVRRYLLFLEDWHWGHIIQIGNNILSHWKSGDMYTWNQGMYHLSANCGISPKWTCQITGLPTKKSLHLIKKKKFYIRKNKKL